MIDYKFFEINKSGFEDAFGYVNCNLLSGILPQEKFLKTPKEAKKYNGTLFIIDCNIENSILPERVINYRKNKKLATKVIVDISYENGIEEKKYFKKVADIKQHGIKSEDILTVMNKSGMRDFESIIFIDFFAISAVIRHLTFLTPVSNKLLSERTNRCNLLLGKINKPSRRKIIEAFFKSKLKDTTLYSFLGTFETDNPQLRKFVKKHQGPIDNVKTFDLKSGISSQGWSNSTKAYDESTVSFICETHETDNSVFFTEKIYRPILNRSPFVIRASFPALAHLRANGFKTFDDFIDEGYDSNWDITDEYSNMLVSTAEKLLSKVPKHYNKMQEIVDYNYEVLVKFAFSELKRLEKRLETLLRS